MGWFARKMKKTDEKYVVGKGSKESTRGKEVIEKSPSILEVEDSKSIPRSRDISIKRLEERLVKFQYVDIKSKDYFSIDGTIYPATHYFLIKTIGNPAKYFAITHKLFFKQFKLRATK